MVNVEAPLKVVDFMLENAGEPAARLDPFWLGAFIGVFDRDAARTFDQRAEAGQTQAPLIKLRGIFRMFDDARVDEHEEWHRLALALGQTLRGDVLQVFRAILDHRQLERQSDLWRREADAGG